MLRTACHAICPSWPPCAVLALYPCSGRLGRRLSLSGRIVRVEARCCSGTECLNGRNTGEARRASMVAWWRLSSDEYQTSNCVRNRIVGGGVRTIIWLFVRWTERSQCRSAMCVHREGLRLTTPGCALLLRIRRSTGFWDSGIDLLRRSHGRYRMKLESIFLTGCPDPSCKTAIADVRTSVSLLVTVRLQVVGPPLARCVTWLCCRSRELSGWFSSGLGLC